MPRQEMPCNIFSATEMQRDIYKDFLGKPVSFFFLVEISSSLPHLLKADVIPGGVAATLPPFSEKHWEKAKTTNGCEDGSDTMELLKEQLWSRTC